MIRSACVVGLGHVGLPTAALMARAGIDVTGCDIDPRVVAALREGRTRVTEPGLGELVAGAVASGLLRASPSPVPAEAFLIAVPTPIDAARRADVSAVEAAADAIAPHLAPGSLVVVESTCPVGAVERLAARFAAFRPGLTLHLAACPERVLPGHALREIVANDRVIGGLTPACAEAARGLYARFVTGRLECTDSRTAELVKLAENAFRDVNIAFANELAGICAALGVEAMAAIRLANRHPRVSILSPGIGVGGHCIPVDPWFLAEAAPEAAGLIRTARAINDRRPEEVAARLREALEGLEAPVLALLGLAYKPDVADLRNSPALAVAEELARDGAIRLLVCDPHLRALPEGLRRPWVELVGQDDAIARADRAALLVPHAAFGVLGAAPGDCLPRAARDLKQPAHPA